jgi:hypothetical protein
LALHGYGNCSMAQFATGESATGSTAQVLFWAIYGYIDYNTNKYKTIRSYWGVNTMDSGVYEWKFC